MKIKLSTRNAFANILASLLKKSAKQLLVLILMNACLAGYSQSKVRSIDWQNLDDINEVKKLLEPVRNNSFTVFRIENINTFLYKVEITGQGFELQTPMPTELQKLFRLSRQEKTDITDNTEAEEALLKISSGVDQMSQNITSRSDEANSKVKELLKQYNLYYKKAVELNSKLFDIKVRKIELINIAQMDKSGAEIRAKVLALEEISDPKVLYNKFLKLSTDLAQLNEELKLIQELAGLSQNGINKTNDLLEESFKTFKNEDILTLYKEVSFLTEELANPNNFIVQAPPIQMTGDYVEYQCKITPAPTNTLGAYKNAKVITFVIPSYSGIKVDFSVGPTLSLGKGAKDEKYFLEESTTVGKSFLRQRDNNNAGVPGVAAMMHIYDRVASQTALGLLFGIGAGIQSVEEVDLSLYLGGSIIMGKRQKVMLNAGLSLLRVDRLKEQEFKVDAEYNTQDFQIANAVEKVFQPSFFISLSYNLAKKETD